MVTKKYIIYISSFIILLFSLFVFIGGIVDCIIFFDDLKSVKHNEFYDGNYEIKGELCKTTNNDYNNFINEFRENTQKSIIIFPNNIDC